VPNVTTVLRYPCCHCDGGVWTQEVDSSGKPIGAPWGECGCVESGHEAALAAAWEEYMEAAFERQSTDYSRSSDLDTRHRMAEARKLK
jgi:hypothetical protein